MSSTGPAPHSNIHDHDHNIAEPPSRLHRKAPSSTRSINLAAAFTCLQFIFAMYATFLLFFVGPHLDVTKRPETASLELPKRWINGTLLQRHDSQPALTYMTSSLLPGHDVICTFVLDERNDISQRAVSHVDTTILSIKQSLYVEVLRFQQMTRGCETLDELLNLPSRPLASSASSPKVTVILNHQKGRTLCAQIEALQAQTLPFHKLWVLAFNSSFADSLRARVQDFHDSRISFVESNYDFKYFGRFQLALQAINDADHVYILDDFVIPGKKMLEILTHAAGTSKYSNAVLGSAGRILPLRQKDYSFPSYHKYRIREAGLSLPDPAYGIDVVEHVLQVDFLTSSWFLPASLVKTMFAETPLTFATGEDLHLSYQLQKYEGAGSFVIPVDPSDKHTWGNTDEHQRLVDVSESILIHKDIVQMRDKQWWQAMSRGFFTQWAAMYPQQCDAFFYAHSMAEVVDLAPLIHRFRTTPTKKAYVVVAGGKQCPCEDAALQLGWPINSCSDRRFKIFDLGINHIEVGHFDVAVMRDITASVQGLLKIHSPAVLVTVADVLPMGVREALLQAVNHHKTIFIQLPRASIAQSLWMADLKQYSLQQWDKMRISISITTQDQPALLQRLLQSLSRALYVGDSITLSFHIDSRVRQETLKIVSSFQWPHGEKHIRCRAIHGGLIQGVSESWFPSSDNEFGLLLEEDIEVSPLYYIWVKYCLLTYHYSKEHTALPELASISLYTPRVVEVVKERLMWINATQHFQGQWHPNTPYLHQLPCSWGALFFPKIWREFYRYMALRQQIVEGAKQTNSMEILHSRTNYWWQGSWKKFLIELVYLRGYVTLYPNFPNQTSFSRSQIESSTSNKPLMHMREDVEVPLMQDVGRGSIWAVSLPEHKLPPSSKLPVFNLLNQLTTMKGLKVVGSKLKEDELPCKSLEVVTVDYERGEPLIRCMPA